MTGNHLCPPLRNSYENLLIVENQPVGTTIAEFNATDVNDGNLTFQLVSGIGSSDNTLFSSASGVLTNTSLLNYEVSAFRSIRVQSRMSKMLPRNWPKVTVQNVNDVAPLITQGGLSGFYVTTEEIHLHG